MSSAGRNSTLAKVESFPNVVARAGKKLSSKIRVFRFSKVFEGF